MLASEFRKRTTKIPREAIALGALMLSIVAAILVLAVKPVQAKLDSAFSLIPSRNTHQPVANSATPMALTATAAGNPAAVSAVAACKKPNYALEGIASWYGAVLNGHRTASGERFNMYEMTACHKTLPFGTIVRVTDEKTGRSVDVRINDRGVLNEGRVIDLSFAAAAKLGIVKSGLTDVKLQVVKMGNGHHNWVHDAPEEKVVILPPPDGYNGPMNIAQR
jgi:rare lipoprotein A